MSNILYIGILVDVLGRTLGIVDKKIGITTDNVDKRAKQLGKTKSPIGYTMIKAWKFEGDSRKVETTLHSLFADQRTEGEWFSDEKDTIIDGVVSFMDLLGSYGISVEEIDLDNSSKSIDSTSDVIENNQSNKLRRNFNKPHRLHWRRLEGKIFKAQMHGHEGFLKIENGKAISWIKEEEEFVADNPKQSWSVTFRKAHSRDESAASSAAPNVWLMREDIKGGKRMDDLCLALSDSFGESKLYTSYCPEHGETDFYTNSGYCAPCQREINERNRNG